jgi:hypothetical protein
MPFTPPYFARRNTGGAVQPRSYGLHPHPMRGQKNGALRKYRKRTVKNGMKPNLGLYFSQA